MYKFKFADIGEGLHEGTVGEISVKVGDKINEGDTLFVVETDKVTSEIPSPVSGEIKEIMIKEGETVHVGDEIFHIDDGSTGEATAEVAEEPKKEEGGAASVVGDIKVSNDLFSPDKFKKSGGAAKTTPAAAPAAKAVSTGGNPIPSKDSIKPVGTGTPVDVVVIGAGPGGYSVAEHLSKKGFKTVIIEDKFAGGVCLNVGCIPTKTLLKSAKVFDYFKHADTLGLDVDVSKIKLNWTKMQKRKNDVSLQLQNGVKYIIKSAKADYVSGRAEIIDKHNVKVNDTVYTTKYIIIATGSSPRFLPLPGFEDGAKKGLVIDSTDALELKEIPKNFAVIGGGVIGVEFATLFAELGAYVTILEAGKTILGPMDGEVKKVAEKMLKDKGVEIHKSVKINDLKAGVLNYETSDGTKTTIKVDKLLVSIGRTPNNMSLDKSIGLALGERGEIKVNKYMQTSIDNIFAIGDVVGHAMLAHTAYKHAAVVTDALTRQRGIFYDGNKIPGCIFTYPEISSIGRTEEQLKEEKVEYISSVWQNAAVGKNLADGNTIGFSKLLVGKQHGEILGAHLINSTSSDMISEIAVLMETEGTVYELANTVHPHPSIAEGIYEAAVQARGMLDKIKHK